MKLYHWQAGDTHLIIMSGAECWARNALMKHVQDALHEDYNEYQRDILLEVLAQSPTFVAEADYPLVLWHSKTVGVKEPLTPE